jgi:rhodanese-related sulfurtransferase
LVQVDQITAPDLKDWLDHEPGIRVLDVRRKPEWEKGHLSFAALEPLDALACQVDPPADDSPVVVHCQGGYRSIIACSLLAAAGYQNIINLQGGYDAWTRAGLPIEKETPVLA